MFQSVTGVRCFAPETTIGSLRKAGWGNMQDYAYSPRQPIRLDKIGDWGSGFAILRFPARGGLCGQRAKQAASKLVLGGEVTLQTYGKDKYGRTIADVLLLDGTSVNHTLVEDGWCWWYRKYAPRNTELARLEKHARETKKGLWADPQPVPPWEWRKRISLLHNSNSKYPLPLEGMRFSGSP
jgi:hypothetical protein